MGKRWLNAMLLTLFWSQSDITKNYTGSSFIYPERVIFQGFDLHQWMGV